MTSNHHTVSSVACQLVEFFSSSGAIALAKWVKALYSRAAARNQLNCRGSRPHSRTAHYEGVVSLTIIILFGTVSSLFV